MLHYLGKIRCNPSESRNNTQGLRAEREFADVGGGAFDPVLQAIYGGTVGNALTLSLVGDAMGVSIVRVGNATTIHYKSGTSTVGNIEDVITAAAISDPVVAKIQVKTSGTRATVLQTLTDDFTDATFAGGEAGFTLPSTLRKIGLLTTAASQAVEVKPDATEPSTFTTSSASAGVGAPLTANVLRAVPVQSASADHVVAAFNGDAAEQSVRVYAMAK